MQFKIYLCTDNLGEQNFIFCPLANISLKAKHQSPKSEKQSCCTPARREHIWTVLRLGKPVFLSYLSAVGNRHDEGESSSKPFHACLNPSSHTCVPRVFTHDYPSRKRRNWSERKPQIKAEKAFSFFFKSHSHFIFLNF